MVLAHLPAAAPCSQLRCRRFLALARAKLYWMVPCWGGPTAEQLPVETQLLLLELEASGAGGCMKTAEWAVLARLCAGAHARHCLPGCISHQPTSFPPCTICTPSPCRMAATACWRP